MSICKLCLRDKGLKHSHIIPEFMYQHVYEKRIKRFKALTVDFANNQKPHLKYEQSGIREDLLCGDCELLLSKYEKYAAETFYSNNGKYNAFCTNTKKIGDKIIYEFNGFLYKEFKIFLLSLVWRIIIAKQYNIQNIDEEIKEKLRTAILNQDPLNYDDFGCSIQILRDNEGHLESKLIYGPFLAINNNIKTLIIIIDGFKYIFFLNHIDITKDKIKWFLNVDGSIDIMCSSLSLDENLTYILKTMSDLMSKSDINGVPF